MTVSIFSIFELSTTNSSLFSFTFSPFLGSVCLAGSLSLMGISYSFVGVLVLFGSPVEIL